MSGISEIEHHRISVNTTCLLPIIGGLLLSLHGKGQDSIALQQTVDRQLKSNQVIRLPSEEHQLYPSLESLERRAKTLHITQFIILDSNTDQLIALKYARKGDTIRIINKFGLDTFHVVKTGWQLIRGYSGDSRFWTKDGVLHINGISWGHNSADVEDP